MIAGVSAARPPRAAAFGFIFATSLLNAISFGIMIPILPNLIKQMTGGDTASASEWNVLFATTWGAMQFICGPLLGMLSDRFGRRPVMLVSIFGLAVDFMFMALSPTLGWLFVGRVLNGVTASSFSTANAYVADITTPEQRARNFGLLGSTFGFGFMVGPSIGGLLGEHNLRLPFFVAAGLCLVNALYGLFVLPESLPPERRAPSLPWSRANPVGALAFLRARGDLLGLAGVGFLNQLAQTVLPTIFVLYTGFRYDWTPEILGFTFMASGASMIAVQMFLVGPVVSRLGERGAVLLGAGAGALGFLIYALAPSGWFYLAGVPVFALIGLMQPGLLGLMSRRVDPRRQGQLQGAIQSLQGIASMIGPSLFGLTFAWLVRRDARLHLSGGAILISAGLLLAGLLISLRVARPAPAAPSGVALRGRRAALGFVFVAVVLDVLALGITAPVLPTLIKQLVGGQAPLAARWVGWFAAIWAIMQFFASPIIGALSDRFGRRPVLLASMFGQAGDYVVMALAPSVGWLFLGRIISGVTASSFATANAYIADITPEAERASRFGVLSAAFGIGFIAGPALGGLLGQIDPRAPFWGAGIVCLLNGLYGLFVVPESLAPENRRRFSLKLANPVGSFDLYATRAGLPALACIMFIYYLAHQVLQSTWVPYASWRYHWSPGVMGASLMIVGAGSIIVQVVVVKPFVARFGQKGALAAGLAMGALGFSLFGWAPMGWMFLTSIPVFSLMGLVGPGLQGLMTRRVGPSEQGRLQGANTGLMAIASIGGPIFFTEVFARSIGGWSGWAPPGLAFYAAGGLMVLALALAVTIRRRQALSTAGAD